MKEKIKRFFLSNYLILAFLIIAVINELTGVCATTGKFYIVSPWLFLSVVFLFAAAALFIPNQKVRHIYLSIVLGLLYILGLIFIIIYELTGTVFDFSMFGLRRDAMNIIEFVPVNFIFTFISGILIAAYAVFGRIFIRSMPEAKAVRIPVVVKVGTLAVIITAHALFACLPNRNNNTADLSNMLYTKNDSTFSNKGIVGNFVNEMYKGIFFNTVPLGDSIELENFIYAKVSEPSELFGAAEGYNVVTILGESFEWFSFLADSARYPNGYAVEESVLRGLFPNLYKFYDSSIVATNFHALEKTDISENLSIMGNYPLGSYINYNYPYNSLPYSIPNTLNTLENVISKSFHNGTASFYNRDVHHVNALGFYSYTASEQMDITKDDTGLGERNLDSEMMEACKEEMFPADRRFNTFITTISMHGQYAYRTNLEQYYEKLDAAGILPLQDGLNSAAENANAFRYYAASAMELDKAVGIVTDYLEEQGLTDRTVVALFGDHNVYYQQVTNYIKNIYKPYETDANYNELYRVPLMIKVGNQTEQRIVDKFACTADIVPTLLDLLGIRYYSNLYYGHSLFDAEESLLYSRAYDKFMTDKLLFTSLNNIKYRAPGVNEDYMLQVENAALALLNKISHVNRIFAYDFLAGDNLVVYNQKLKELNA